MLCIYLSDNLLESSNVSNSNVRMFCGYLHAISQVIPHIDDYTDGLEMCWFGCSPLVPNCFDDAGILDSALHRYPTHIRSPNYCRRTGIGEAIVMQKSLKLTFIHAGSRMECFCAVNLCQTASMMWVFWIMLYTGTLHIFGLPTTDIACVFLKQ